MKEKLLTYNGYLNSLFCFADPAGKKINFKKSRKELIEAFSLLDKSHVGKLFLVKYFIVSETDLDTYILSDLELAKTVEED